MQENEEQQSDQRPSGREAMDKFKMQAAQEMGVNLKQGYNGDLTSREAGRQRRRPDGQEDDRGLRAGYAVTCQTRGAYGRSGLHEKFPEI